MIELYRIITCVLAGALLLLANVWAVSIIRDRGSFMDAVTIAIAFLILNSVYWVRVIEYFANILY